MVRPPPSKLAPPLPRVRGWPPAPSTPPAQGLGKSIESVMRPVPPAALGPSLRSPPSSASAAVLDNLDPDLFPRGFEPGPGGFEPGPGGVLTPRPPSSGLPGARRPPRRASSEGPDSAGRDAPLSARDRATPRERPPLHVPPLTARERREPAEAAKQPRSSSHSRRTPREREGSRPTSAGARPEERPEARPMRGSSARHTSKDGGAPLGGYPEKSPARGEPRPRVASQSRTSRPPRSPPEQVASSPSPRSELSCELAEHSLSGSTCEPVMASPTAAALAIVAAEQASPDAAAGPSPGFLSLLEQMENDKKMWEEKMLSLMAGPSSRPGTAGSATAGAASRPGTASAPEVRAEELRAGADEEAQASSSPFVEDEEEGNVAESVPASPDIHSRTEDAASPSSSSSSSVAPEAEEEPGESLIAAALRAAGVEPSLEAVADFVRGGEKPAGQRRQSSSWAWSSKQWAAERLKRKKERCGSRSGAGTPLGAAAGNTPCGSSPASPEPPSRPSTAGL